MCNFFLLSCYYYTSQQQCAEQRRRCCEVKTVEAFGTGRESFRLFYFSLHFILRLCHVFSVDSTWRTFFVFCYFIELKNFAIYHKRVTDFDILVGDVEQDELVRSRLDATAVVITVVTGTAHFGVTFILVGELHCETVIPLLIFKLFCTRTIQSTK